MARAESKSRHACVTYPTPAAAQLVARSDARDNRHGARRALRLGRLGTTHLAALLQQRTEHRVEPEVLAQDAVGSREGGEPLPLHVARHPAGPGRRPET